MNSLLRNALQRVRFVAQRAGYTINKAEAFAFPDQRELMAHRDVRTVFDVGANNGSVVKQYRKLFPGSTIHCFEAIPELAEKIRNRFPDDPEIKVYPVAVAEAPGRRQFNVNTSVVTSSLLRSSMENIPSSYRSIQNAARVIDVECVTIDAICKSQSIPDIDILKMDIQGGELAALRGASGMLANAAIQLIYTEVWFLPFYDNQPLFGDICHFLAKFDYALQAIYNVGFSGTTGRMTWADAIFVAPQLKDRSSELLKAKHGA